MELLISFLVSVFAFVGGMVGNILASDLCASADATCSRIIRAAAKRTGDEAQQLRYEEEWLADLAERETVNAKYRHAIGCYFISQKIRRESRKLWLHVIYVIPRYGRVQAKFNLNSWFSSIWFAAMNANVDFIKRSAAGAGISYYALRFARAAYKGEPNQLLQLVEFVLDSVKDRSAKDWPFEVRISRSGKSWNLTKIAQLIVKEPNAALTVLKSKIDGNNPREIAEALIQPRKKVDECDGK